MDDITLTLFGSFEVKCGETQVTGFRSDKTRALLAYLAMEANQPHRRDALAGLLWPELPEKNAHDNLRLALHRLRHAFTQTGVELPPTVLHVTPKTIQFNRVAPCAVDVVCFTDALQASRTHPHPRLETCPVCAQTLAQAVNAYRGDLLTGFFIDSQPFDEWLLIRREALRAQMLAALATLTTYAEERGEYALAQQYARRQLEMDAWNEDAHFQLMRALALAGQRSTALAQYDRCTHILKTELDVEPGDKLQALHTQLLAGKTLSRAPEPKRRFPPPSTPFIGRQAELAQVAAALTDPHCRLLTVLGPGGVGKTRLALQVAYLQEESWLHGVHFIPLEGIDNPDFLVPALANGLPFPFHDQGDRFAQLCNALRGKQMLLILDNFEQLLAGTSLLETLLAHAPGVKLLVTSRQRLQLPNERILLLAGLGYPAEERLHYWQEMEAFGAVALFSEIALGLGVWMKDRPDDWPTLIHICQLVEGLPLGLELAAAWLKLLSPEEIVREIARDLTFLSTLQAEHPARHRSLHAVCDTSWRLLSEEERDVLRGVAVFRGGFTWEAAREVAGATPHLLAALTDKSLVRCRGKGTFDLQEMLRQYILQKSAPQSENGQTIRARHCVYYQTVLAQRQPALEQAIQQGERPPALLELTRESANLRASWQWALQQPLNGETIAYVDRLGQFYDFLGWPQETRPLYELALQGQMTGVQARETQHTRARWTYGLGKAYLSLGMVARGRQTVENALQQWGHRLPASRVWLPLALLGQVAFHIGLRMLPAPHPTPPPARPEADHAFSQLAEISYLSNQRLDSLYYALRVLNLTGRQAASVTRARTEANFCLGAGTLGLHRVAGVFYRRARASVQNVDEALTRAYVYQVTGIYDLGQGRWEPAQQALRYAADLFKQGGYRRQWGECVMSQTIITSAQGQINETVALLDTLLAASQETGDLLQQGWALAGLAHLDLLTGQTEAAIARLKTYLDISQTVAHVPGMLTAYGLLSVAHLRQDEMLLARHAAEAGAKQISHSSHTVFTNTEGYSAVAETFLGLLARETPLGKEARALWQPTEQVLKALQVQARGVPAGRARYWLLRGQARWLRGHSRAAFRDWHQSLAEAERLHMPYDAGRARYEIGRHLPGEHPQRVHALTQAQEILAELGAVYYCQQAEAALRLEGVSRFTHAQAAQTPAESQ